MLKQDSSSLFTKNKEPGPFDEVNFWQTRLKNLENIYSQLRDPRVKQVGNVLEIIDSVYCQSFKQTFKNVVNALHEARDITLWLKPLEKYFDDFETQEFLDLRDKIHPLLHCICLLWAHSPYYAKNSRMVILFKVVNNMIINCATRALDPEALFQGEPYEVLAKLDQAVEMLNLWRDQYFVYKERLREYQLPNTTAIFWSFRPKDIFERYDLFLKRLAEVREILVTADDFMKLERVEIGGLKGRMISRQIKNIFDEFRDKIYKEWKEIKFDPLDPDAKKQHFKKQKKLFQENSDILEMRLAIQFRYAFEDCANLDQLIKLVHIGGSLLSRPLVVQQIGEKLLSLMHLFNDDLDLIKNCYDKGVQGYELKGFNGVPIDGGFPNIAGTLMWLHKLRSRLQKPSGDMELLEFPIFDNDEGKYILTRKDQMLELLNGFEAKIFNEWKESVPGLINKGLSEYLLIRSDRLLEMNYTSNLENNLHEVRYLKNMGKEEIPQIALDLFARSNEIWDVRMQLMRIVEWYNDIQTKTNEQELDILQEEILDLDKFLEKLITSFTWSKYDADYIKSAYDRLKSLHKRLMRSQQNIRDIVDKIKSFGQRPLYERRDGRLDTLILLDDDEVRLTARTENCKETQLLIDKVMDENFRLLFNLPLKDETPEPEVAAVVEELEDEQTVVAEEKHETEKEVNTSEKLRLERGSQVGTSLLEIESRKSSELQKTQSQILLYNQYEKYVDGVVGEELMESIRVSVKYIKFEMENRLERNTPIFESHLSLYLYKRLSFRPAMSLTYVGSLMEIVNTMLDYIYNMAEQIKRIYIPYRQDANGMEEDSQTLPTYLDLLIEETTIHEMKQDIISNVRRTCRDVLEYYKQYEEKYDYLWLDDQDLFMERFLLYGRALTPEEIETIDTPDCKLKPEREITLSMFRKQIDYFYKVYEEVQKIEKSHTFNIWLIINMKQFIAGLANVVMKWCSMIKSHLKTEVVRKLNVSN